MKLKLFRTLFASALLLVVFSCDSKTETNDEPDEQTPEGGSGPDAQGGRAGAPSKAGSGGQSDSEGCDPETCPEIETRPAGCAVAECKEGECRYSAIDADNDGHKSARCQSLTPGVAVEPGFDCADGDPLVNPSAWDGPSDGTLPNGCNDDLDNDCSGGIDDASLEDGTTCTCAPGETKPCSQTASGLPIEFPLLDDRERPVGTCRLGSSTCMPNGTWAECTGAIPPQNETCDGDDNDCDGIASKEDPQTPKTTWFCDRDSDNHLAVTDVGSAVSCDPPEDGCPGQWIAENSATVDDCDDEDDGTYLGATEFCDGADNDCDGAIDDNAIDMQVWSYDADADFSRRDEFAAVQQCDPPATAPANCAAVQESCPADGWHGSAGPLPPGDCDDNAKSRNPSATRDLCDGTDYNCDGSPLTGCACSLGQTQPCGTHPQDGVGVCRAGSQQCLGGVWGDCVGSVSPSAEVCGTADLDCDGTPGNTDPDAVNRATFYCDRDADTVMAPGTKGVVSCLTPTASCAGAWRKNPDAADFTDCDDTSNLVKPGAAERCNRIDDNCDKSAGKTTPSAEPNEDADNDGFAAITAACTGGTLPKTDCYDGDNRAKPTQTNRYNTGYCPIPSHPYWCGNEGFRNCLRVAGCNDIPTTGLAANFDFDCDSREVPYDRFEIGMTEGLWSNTCAVMVDGGAAECATLVPEYVRSGTCGKPGTHRRCGVDVQSGSITLCGAVDSTKNVACR